MGPPSIPMTLTVLPAGVSGISGPVWFVPPWSWYNPNRTGWYGSYLLDHQENRAESTRSVLWLRRDLLDYSNGPSVRVHPARRFTGDPQLAAGAVGRPRHGRSGSARGSHDHRRRLHRRLSQALGSHPQRGPGAGLAPAGCAH